MMEEGLIALLLSNPRLTGEVGDRVHWNEFPQGIASPAVALYRVSGSQLYTSAGPVDMEPARVQIDTRVSASSPQDRQAFTRALQIGRVIKAQLSGFRGSAGGARFGGVFLRRFDADNDFTGAEYFHRVSMDFEVWSSPAG